MITGMGCEGSTCADLMNHSVYAAQRSQGLPSTIMLICASGVECGRRRQQQMLQWHAPASARGAVLHAVIASHSACSER
jgi:hypothetical protein